MSKYQVWVSNLDITHNILVSKFCIPYLLCSLCKRYAIQQFMSNTVVLWLDIRQTSPFTRTLVGVLLRTGFPSMTVQLVWSLEFLRIGFLLWKLNDGVHVTDLNTIHWRYGAYWYSPYFPHIIPLFWTIVSNSIQIGRLETMVKDGICQSVKYWSGTDTKVLDILHCLLCDVISPNFDMVSLTVLKGRLDCDGIWKGCIESTDLARKWHHLRCLFLIYWYYTWGI